MLKGIVERIFYELYAEEPDNEEIMFYYHKLYDDIKLFAAPKHNELDVENHFYDIISGLCRAEELQAFKRGLSHALLLFADCTASPNLSKGQAQDEYKKISGKEAKYAEELRAALKSEATV